MQTRTTTRNSAQQPKNKWVILSVICLGAFMTSLDGSIVNIALPTISRAFGVALNGQIQWVVIGYLVMIAAALLTFGRLADAVGAKRVWSVGIIFFAVSSAACGFAPGLVWLVIFRAVQGVGAAMILATSAALITSTFPGNQRGRALGINAVVVSLAVSAGPVLGGLITEYASWRWIFFINVPIGVLNFFWTLRTLPPDQKGQGSGFDFTGAVLIALGLGGLTLGLSFGRQWGWSSLPILAALGLGALSFAAALFAETRVKHPLIDLKMFQNRTFTSATFSLMLSFVAFFSATFLLPFYFEQLRGFSTSRAGLLLVSLSVGIGLIGPLSGALADRIGSRLLAPLGLAVAAAGLFLISRFDGNTALWFIIVALAVSGVGLGIFASPNSSSLMGAAPDNKRGVASGLLATSRTVGQALGIAVSGAIFGGLGGAVAGDRLAQGAAGASLAATFAQAFDTALLVAAGVAVLAFAVALVRKGKKA